MVSSVYDRKLTLVSDHKPLTTIFGPKPGVPTFAVVRLQRWLLIFISYDYNIVYKKGIEHGNADFMNRAPFEKAKCDIELFLSC